MAEKTIKHASFWYVNADGINETALRGDTVDIPGEVDIKRGERLGAFATEDDLAEGSPFAQFVARRNAALAPGVVSLDPAEVEGRISPAGSADPAIQSGMVDPASVPAKAPAKSAQPTRKS